MYKCCSSIEYLISNYEIIKPIYEKIEDNNFMLKFIITTLWQKHSYYRTMFKDYGILINNLIKYKIIKIDETTTLDNNVIKNIVTNLKIPNNIKETLISNLRSLFVQLMHHGFKPNNDLSELIKLIFKEHELKNLDEFVKDNALCEVIKKPKKIINKKKNDIVL